METGQEAERSRKVEKVRIIACRLKEFYSISLSISSRSPAEELVHAILSQNTSRRNYDLAFSRLIEKFGTLEEIERANIEDIEAAIRPGGLSRKKAMVIKNVLESIRSRTGGLSLDFLASLSVEDARDFLTSLPGVGAKTASVVLLFGFGREVLPVDTHVLRTSKRIGILPFRVDAVQAEKELEDLCPPDLRPVLHLGLVKLGREVCRARRAYHESCPVSELCETYEESKPHLL